MQPEQPQYSPQPQQPNTSQPDYSFLNQQPKKSSLIPSFGNSVAGKIFVVIIVLILLTVVAIIVKGILVPSAFSRADFTVLVERQQEIIHITSANYEVSTVPQLNVGNKNFAATTLTAVTTAQTKTLEFMSDYKYKYNTQTLSKFFNASIDQQLSNALSTNTYNSVFQSVMQLQLTNYEKELKIAYNSTHVSSGRSLIKSEYDEAKLLLRGLP